MRPNSNNFSSVLVKRPLKRCAYFIEGPGIMASDFRDSGVPLLRISCIGESEVTLDGCNFLEVEKVDKRWAHFRVKRGDLIISGSASTGLCSEVLNSDVVGAIPYTGLIIVRPQIYLAEKGFLRWFFLSNSFQQQVDSVSTGTAIKHFGPSHLAAMTILTPTLPIQSAIAGYLDRETKRLDELVRAKEELLELVAEKRRALITRAVTRGLNAKAALRDSGIPWLGMIPKHWPLLRAKYLWKEQSLPIREGDEMVTCFRDGQVTLRKNRREEGFTVGMKELGYQGIRVGQLVLHSMDAFAGAIGVSDSDGKCTPEYIICDAIRDDIHHPYYGHLLRVMALNGFVQATCTAVRERAPRIHFSDFGDMVYPVPPLTEQRAIVAHIATETAKLDALRGSAERTIALLKERRSALISAAVTGKIAISEPTA